MSEKINTPTIGAVAVVIAVEVFLSCVLAFCLPWSQKRNLVFVGTADQMLGVFLIAWPDLENTAKVALSQTCRSIREGTAWAKSMTRRAIDALKSMAYQAKKMVANVYERVRGRGRNIPIRLESAITPTGNLGLGVIRTDSVEKRLSRLENEVARLPGQWRDDMNALRDSRIKLRWYGVPLVLVGTLMLGIAGW
jgi:hypothetical protein